MRFYRGELLWVLRRWKDAAEQYTEVVASQPGGKYTRDAAYAAVLAWKNALVSGDEPRAAGDPARAREQRMADRDTCGRATPRPIPDNQQKMIAAFHTYTKQLPDAPELPVMIYREAYIYYDHDHYDRAEPLFLEVVAEVPEARAGGVRGEPVSRFAEHGVQGARRWSRGRTSSSRCPSWRATPNSSIQMIVADQRRLRSRRARVREAAATPRNAAGRSWPPPRRCPRMPSTPSGCGTPASASRTRT